MSPRLVAAWRPPIHFLRNVLFGHSAQQFIERVAWLARRLDNWAQHQNSVLDTDFSPLAIANFEGIGNRFRDAHGETIAPLAKLDDHGVSDCIYEVYCQCCCQQPTVEAGSENPLTD